MNHRTRFGAAIAACCFPALAQGESSCCVAHPSAGCDDSSCQAVVCVIDTFCCTNQWDALCVAAAGAVCPECGGDPCSSPVAGACCTPNATPACNDPECCEAVCAQDSFCCNSEWDELCAEASASLCPTCIVGACCLADGCLVTSQAACLASGGEFTPDVDCFNVECVTPSPGACCGVGGTCQLLPETVCIAVGGFFLGGGSNCAQADCCEGDTNADGVVDSVDLNRVLAGFGCFGPSCPGDVDFNDATDSADLNIVLSSYGCGLIR